MQIVAVIAGLATLFSYVAAECPNACSAHGRCGAFDMCICYRNWMSNDCSERICQFGLAHVDTPKGDLDSSSGALGGPNVNVVPNNDMYPFGTTEQYPATTDIDGAVLHNTAHEYRECSNKGICDRGSGTCQCFEGYDGSACQRASCPSTGGGVCSGHGTCETIQEIAGRDFGNIYRLWDEDATMGCVCDGGYTGPDCSERQCKYGADPLYYDDEQNIRYSNWTYQFYTTTLNAALTGNYSLVFYDAHGEDWQTTALPWNATCEVVTQALEDLPNDVIPDGSVKCFKSDLTSDATAHGQDPNFEPIYEPSMYLFSKYTIAFPENPGRLQQIEINKYLDGSRATLYTDEGTSSLGWHIYPNGFIGESTDFVSDRCEDVTVNLVYTGGDTTHQLSGLDVTEMKLLKECLGDVDGDTTNNVEVYNWDWGDAENPHLIKLIDATQDASIVTTDADGDTDTDYALSQYPITQLCAISNGDPRDASFFNVDGYGIYYCHNKNPPGFYAVIYYDNPTSTFRVFTRAALDYASTTDFYVYTTKGTMQRVSPDAGVFTTSGEYPLTVNVGRHYSNVLYMTNTSVEESYYGDVACETNPVGSNNADACVNKDDWVMILNTDNTAAGLAANPAYPNIYQVKKVGREEQSFVTNPDTVNDEKVRNQIVLDYSMNAKYDYTGDSIARVYKFTPDSTQPTGGYHYAAECSNRGICNKGSGICSCFAGYTGDNCGEVNALAG